MRLRNEFSFRLGAATRSPLRLLLRVCVSEYHLVSVSLRALFRVPVRPACCMLWNALELCLLLLQDGLFCSVFTRFDPRALGLSSSRATFRVVVHHHVAIEWM